MSSSNCKYDLLLSDVTLCTGDETLDSAYLGVTGRSITRLGADVKMLGASIL